MPKYYDSTGKEITLNASTPTTPAENQLKKKPKYYTQTGEQLDLDTMTAIGQKPEWQDYFRHYAGKFIPPALSMGAGILGTAASPGVGTGVGALAGNQAGIGLQEKWPRLFGEPPADKMVSAAVDVAGAYIPMGIAKVGNAAVRFGTEIAKNPTPGAALKSKLASAPVLRHHPSVQEAMRASQDEEIRRNIQKFMWPQADTLEVAGQNVLQENPGQFFSRLPERNVPAFSELPNRSLPAFSKLPQRTLPAFSELPNVKSPTTNAKPIGKNKAPGAHIGDTSYDPGPLPKQNRYKPEYDPGPLPGTNKYRPEYDPGPLPENRYRGEYDPGPLPQQKYKGTIGEDLLKIPWDKGKDVVEVHMKKVAERALSDVNEVRNFKLATGETNSIEKLALNKITTIGYNQGTKAINPKAMLEELGGKNVEVYKEALTPRTYERFKDFLTEASKIHERPESSLDKVISMADRRAAFTIPFAASGGPLGMMGKVGAVLTLTDSAITKWMQDPRVAELAVAALKTPKTAPQAPFIQDALFRSLSGAGFVYLNTPDGKLEKVEVTPEGKLVPAR